MRAIRAQTTNREVKNRENMVATVVGRLRLGMLKPQAESTEVGEGQLREVASAARRLCQFYVLR